MNARTEMMAVQGATAPPLIYHDGVFEGLDNRKKNNLLRMIKELCDETQIQYILTVIDTDLPRDDNDEKLYFAPNDVVRELSDESDLGRLFKMPKF